MFATFSILKNNNGLQSIIILISGESELLIFTVKSVTTVNPLQDTNEVTIAQFYFLSDNMIIDACSVRQTRPHGGGGRVVVLNCD